MVQIGDAATEIQFIIIHSPNSLSNMKKIYSFLAVCLLGLSALTASAERTVTAMTSRGTTVTSLDQLSSGATVLFRATSRDGYLFENNSKLFLSQGVPASGISSYYLFKLSSFTNNGSDATVTIESPQGFAVPALSKGNNNPQLNASSVVSNFTITKADPSNPNDSIWYIQDEAGLYFNGNQLNTRDTKFGLYGTFAGWDQAGENSRYQIFLPTTETKTLYEVTVNCVDTNFDGLRAPITQEVGLGDSILIPAIGGYHLDLAASTVTTTAGGTTPITLSGNYYKVTGDATLDLTYELNELLFNPISGTDTTWYFLKIRDNYYCFYNDALNDATANGAVPTAANADNKNPDAYLWAFEGDRTNGFRIYNKKAGANLVLTAADISNGSSNYLADKATGNPDLNTYAYKEPVDGKFTLHLLSEDNTYINQFGGTTGKLKFYVHTSGTDGGSLLKVIKYNADSVKQVVIDTKLSLHKAYIQGEGYVNGYTAAQLADLKAAVAAEDTTAADAALAALTAQTPIQFDPTKTYAMISAYGALTGANAGKKFALAFGDSIAAGDSLHRLTWSELPANIQDADAAAGYKWKFVNGTAPVNVNTMERLYTGENDSMHVFYNIENQLLSSTKVAGQQTQMYVGEFQYGQKVPMVAPDAKFGMYLQKTKYPSIFSILGFRTTVNNSGVTSYVRVGLSPVFSNTAPSGYVQSSNNIWSTNQSTNAFYLLEVTPPSSSAVTGISLVEAKQAVKDGVIYDLTGRKVTKATKGVYIINGQKTVVK